MVKKLKETKITGITLISLVLTIIVLLILAGVTIAMLTGENGILGRSKEAVGESNKQEATEMINLKITKAQISSYAETNQMPTLQYLADSLCEDEEIEYVELASKKVGALEKITVGNATSIFTKIDKYPYEFEIGSDLRLASINGIQIAETTNTELEELKTTVANLQSNYEQLRQEITNLSNLDNTWQEAVSVQGKTEKNFDFTDYDEIMIEVQYERNGVEFLCSNSVSTKNLSSDLKSFIISGHYTNATTFSRVVVSLSNSKVLLKTCENSGTDFSGSANMSVYVK